MNTWKAPSIYWMFLFDIGNERFWEVLALCCVYNRDIVWLLRTSNKNKLSTHFHKVLEKYKNHWTKNNWKLVSVYSIALWTSAFRNLNLQKNVSQPSAAESAFKSFLKNENKSHVFYFVFFVNYFHFRNISRTVQCQISIYN